MKNGVMASINQVIDFDTAAIVAHDMGFEPLEAAGAASTAEVAVERETGTPDDRGRRGEAAAAAAGRDDPGPRRPRQDEPARRDPRDEGDGGARAAASRSTSAPTRCEVNGQKITFLDTPGHEAFTAMRARGAQVTDVAVLVVAADDGVMPQTKEAIDHAKAAGVPIVVAHQQDRPRGRQPRPREEASSPRTASSSRSGAARRRWCRSRRGRRRGSTTCSANILVVSEVLELKANPDRPAIGIVVEAELSKTRGPLATVLVKTGTLHAGDYVVVGETMGRVKAMLDEHGKRIKTAGPSEPAEILGLQEVPKAGETLHRRAGREDGARTMVLERIREREAAAMHAAAARHAGHAVRRDQRRQAQGTQHHPQDGRAGLDRADPHVAGAAEQRAGEGEDHPHRLRRGHRVRRHAGDRLEGHHHRLQHRHGGRRRAHRAARRRSTSATTASSTTSSRTSRRRSRACWSRPSRRSSPATPRCARSSASRARTPSPAAYVRDGTITRTDTARVLRNGAVVARGQDRDAEALPGGRARGADELRVRHPDRGLRELRGRRRHRVLPHRARDVAGRGQQNVTWRLRFGGAVII